MSNIPLLLLCAAVSVAMATTWQPVVWGGGGYVTGFVFHPAVQDLVYARTDVGGAYRRDPGSRTWHPVLDTLPREDPDLQAIFSMAVDRQNPNLLYLAAGMYTASWGRNAAILRSADRGLTWARTELPIRLGGNEDGRGLGERLQVDPNLGSVLYLGTSKDGLYKSADSGVTWAQVASFPLPTAGTTFVRFNATSAAPGQVTPHIYVGVASASGASLYESRNAGATWTALPQPAPGLMPMSADTDGATQLYVTWSNALGPNGVTDGGVYVWDAVARRWTNISPEAPGGGFGYAGLAVSATAPNLIVVSSLDRWAKGDELYRTLNGGRTWTAMSTRSAHSATANSWLGSWWPSTKMGWWITSITIDPFNESHLLHNFGVGLWETDALLCPQCSWTFAVTGLEETVVTALASPPSGAHLFVTQGDVGGARYDTDLTQAQPFVLGNVTTHGVDYAHWWTNFMARTTESVEAAFLSWDNGVTWSPIAAQPPSVTDSGRIAISANGATLLWAPGRQSAFYSTSNGQTWTACTGYPISDAFQSGGFFTPVADRAAGAYFYTYDFVGGRLLQSADSGATFQTAFSGLDVLPTYASTHQLTSVPTKTRDLWLGTPNGLYHIDGLAASAPVRIAGVQAAYGVGYGAPAPGQAYPTMYVSAKIGNVIGLYRSVDVGVTWARIDDDQHRYASNMIVGDQRIFGRVYIAPAGRGVMMGDTA